MKKNKIGLYLGIIALSISSSAIAQVTQPVPKVKTWLFAHRVERDVPVKDYFQYMDKMVQKYDTLVSYGLTVHLLMRRNAWIVDTLESTDYYRRKERGSFVFDQKKLIILKKGDTLFIPNDTIAHEMLRKQAQTILDLNIPEFKLRIIEGHDTIATYLMRVGQNRIHQWVVYDDKVADLRTRTGTGKIIKIYYKSFFLDPAVGLNYYKTHRDDGKVTMMPLMPWLEPEINGQALGQLIHPTTNEKSLGKAFSNGCIGTREGDMWRIYYHAPIGTRVQIRYDLDVKDEHGKLVRLKDVYGAKPKKE
jgi:hypothetical protein